MLGGTIHSVAATAASSVSALLTTHSASSVTTPLSKLVSPPLTAPMMWTQSALHAHTHPASATATATQTQSVGLTTTSQSNLQALQQQQQAQLQQQQQQALPMFAPVSGGHLSPNGTSTVHPPYLSTLSMPPMQPHPLLSVPSSQMMTHPQAPPQFQMASSAHPQAPAQFQMATATQFTHAQDPQHMAQMQMRFQHQQLMQQQQMQQAHAVAMAQAQAQAQQQAAAAAAMMQPQPQPSIPAYHLSLHVHGAPDLPYPSYFDLSAQAAEAHPLLCSTCQHAIPRGDVMIASVSLSFGHGQGAAADASAVKPESSTSTPSASPTFFRHLECAHPSHLIAFPEHSHHLIQGYFTLNAHQQMVVEQRLQYARNGGAAGMGMMGGMRPMPAPITTTMGLHGHAGLHNPHMLPTIPPISLSPQLTGGAHSATRSPPLRAVMASTVSQPFHHHRSTQQKQSHRAGETSKRSTATHTPSRSASRTHTSTHSSASATPTPLTATGRPQRSTSKKARHGDFKYTSDHSDPEDHGEGGEGDDASSHARGSQGSHDDAAAGDAGRSSDPDVEPEEEEEEDDEDEEEEEDANEEEYDEHRPSARRKSSSAVTSHARSQQRHNTAHARTSASSHPSLARSASHNSGSHARSPGASTSTAVSAPGVGQKRKRTRKDPNAPKRPASNYMYWCRSRRPQLKAEFPEVNSNILMQKLAVEWRAMDFTTPAGKKALAHWDALHLKDQRRYQKQMKEWKEKGEYTEVNEEEEQEQEQGEEEETGTAPAVASASAHGSEEPSPGLPRIVSNQSTSTSASTSSGSSAVGPPSASSTSTRATTVSVSAAAAVACANAAAAAASAADPSAIVMDDGSPEALAAFRRIHAAERMLPAAALQHPSLQSKRAALSSTVAAAADVSKVTSTPTPHALADLLVGMSEIA